MKFSTRLALLVIAISAASQAGAAPTATLVLPTAAEAARSKTDASGIVDLKSRAAGGDIRAQIELGVAYRDGKGMAADPAQALKWFRKAAEKNDPAALDNVGWMLEHGLGAPADVPEAARHYHAAADQHLAQAQWNLGRLYAETDWGKYDNAEAARWFRRAADAGHAEAQYRLGLAYMQGTGLAADDAAACQWFRKSADHGNLSETLALGTMYYLGRGVAQSDDEARAWFKKGVRIDKGKPGNEYTDGSHAADALEWLDLREKPAVAGQFACLKVPHISEGWNMCGVASATMATAFGGATGDQYEIKRLCGSPMGEGTDWLDIISAAAKVKHHWELVTFPYDKKGLDAGRKRMMPWLDAGHPILLDITVVVDGESFGHTVVVMGYDAAGERWIINNPAIGPPGIEICNVAKLDNLWHSRWYSSKSPGVSRPIILTQ